VTDHTSTPLRRALAALGLVLAAGAALGSPPQPAPPQTEPRSQPVDLEVGDAEAWIRIDAYARTLVLGVEAAGSRARSLRPGTRAGRNILLWQTNLCTALLAAASQPSPGIAALDVWALVVQNRAFFSSDEADDLVGNGRELLLASARTASDDFDPVALAIFGEDDTPHLREQVVAWAEAHPLLPPNFARPSGAVELLHYADLDAPGALESLRRIGSQEGTLRSRAGLLVEILPRVLRWQALLALAEPQYRDLVVRSSTTLDGVEELLAGREKLIDGLLADVDALADRHEKRVLENVDALVDTAIAEKLPAAVEPVLDGLFDRARALVALVFLGAVVLVLLVHFLPRRG